MAGTVLGAGDDSENESLCPKGACSLAAEAVHSLRTCLLSHHTMNQVHTGVQHGEQNTEPQSQVFTDCCLL